MSAGTVLTAARSSKRDLRSFHCSMWWSRILARCSHANEQWKMHNNQDTQSSIKGAQCCSLWSAHWNRTSAFPGRGGKVGWNMSTEPLEGLINTKESEAHPSSSWPLLLLSCHEEWPEAWDTPSLRQGLLAVDESHLEESTAGRGWAVFPPCTDNLASGYMLKAQSCIF